MVLSILLPPLPCTLSFNTTLRLSFFPSLLSLSFEKAKERNEWKE
jgi:hypothetical protein